MNKVILTAAIGFADKPDHMAGLRRMINSARLNIPDATIMVLTDKPLSLPGYVIQQWAPPVNGHPVCTRWWIFADILPFLQRDAMVVITDSRDVVFQRDIFRTVKYDAVSMYLEDARHTVDKEQANSAWVRRLMGYDAATLGAVPIACAGLVSGPVDRLTVHVRAMCQAFGARQLSEFGADQAAHNIVARMSTHQYAWHDNGLPALHCVLTPEHEIVLTGGLVQWSQSKAPAFAVHQYDRHRTILDHLEAAYGTIPGGNPDGVPHPPRGGQNFTTSAT